MLPAPTTPLVLHVATPPHSAWLAACLGDVAALLSDHAHCERKAAASALSMISRVPQDAVTVTAMAALAREEAGHLSRVHKAMLQRGYGMQPDRKDEYVLALRARVARGKQEQLVDELLVCALIELRSAERLALLGEALPDVELRRMYQELATAEDGHASLFVERARFHAPHDVDARLAAWLAHEGAVMRALPGSARIHG
jgi:tRNA-(ms[2]io[6]A)-hydroxylase